MKDELSSLPWKMIDSFIGNFSHPTLTSYRTCPVCNSIKNQTLLTFNDFQFFTDSSETPKRANLQEVQCKKCHSVYLNPCYTTFGFSCLFAEAGQSYGSTEDRPVEQVEWLNQRGLLGKGKVFLDAGCNDGHFLATLPRHMRRIGVDLDEHAIKRGRTKFSVLAIELIHGAFENFECPTKPDIISMFHVLEHLANPLEALTHLREISKANTNLIIEVPILEHGNTNDINGFLSVQHMTHFSIRSLENILVRAGWKIVESCKIPGYNGYRVIAMPTIAINEVVGNVNDRLLVFEYFQNWYKQLALVAKKQVAVSEISRVVIWGGGMHSEFLYHFTPLFLQSPKREYIIVDTDPLKQGKSWRGVYILPPEALRNISWDCCKLIISSYGNQEAIASNAANMGVPLGNIVRLYDDIDVY